MAYTLAELQLITEPLATEIPAFVAQKEASVGDIRAALGEFNVAFLLTLELLRIINTKPKEII